MFTKEQLAEILAVCAKATEGPWRAVSKQVAGLDRIKRYSYATIVDANGKELIYECWGDGERLYFEYITKEDAQFIALARTALPELARRVMELEEINESIRNWNACEEHLHKTLLDENANLRATVAAMQDALEEIKARCELRRQDDDAHYENYYEAKKALAAAGYGGEE